jgi:regulatory protein
VTITSLQKQKKAKGRYNIYADGEFFCGLYEDTILKYGIHVNEELSEKQLKDIKEYDEYIYGKNVAYNYLSYRIRTVWEIKKKLKEKKISERTIERVVELLEKQKLVDDEEFARVLIAEKVKNKPVGKKVLRQKLFEKGVPKKISEEAIEKALEQIDEKELALICFKKYYVKLKGKEYILQKRKAFDHLARKGFDFDIINEVLGEKLSKT